MERTKSKQFVMLPYSLLDSEIWAGLSRAGKEVYISIRRMKFKRDCRGKAVCVNWDFIPFGHSDLLGSMDKKTFFTALEELRCVKLIKLEIPGSLPKKKAIYSLGLFRR